jgi:hypothetical protein
VLENAGFDGRVFRSHSVIAVVRQFNPHHGSARKLPMAQLKQTKVYRSGRTAPDWYTESTQCSANIKKQDGSLNIRFDIASKGGGTTCLWIEIGSADLRSLLHELAESRSDTAGTFAECVTIAIQRNTEMMDKIRDPLVLEKLESVAAFVDDKYSEAPAGEDDTEKAASDDLRNVIRTVESLNTY